MNRNVLSSLTIVLASLASTPAVAQTVSFGSASPAVAGPDSTAKPDAKPDSVPPKPEFKPSWNFGAWLFGAYTMQTDSAKKAANNGSAFSKFTVDRAYLTFRGQVAPDFGFRVTTDVKQQAISGTYQGLFIRLKYAYMQWDYLHADDATGATAWGRIGQIHTVLIDEEERFWSRWLQKTAIEYWGFMSSSDLGASSQLTLPNKLGWAYLTVANGPGYENPETDRYKDVALRLSLTPLAKGTGLLKNLEITPWGLWGTTQASVVTQAGLKRNRYGITIESLDPRLTFSLEWAEMQNEVDSIGPPFGKKTITSPLYDGFIIVRPFLFANPKGPPLGLVLRYDKFTPNNSASTNSRNESLFLAGVFYDVAKANSSFGITYQDTKPNSGATGPFAVEQTFWQFNWQVTF